MVHQETKIHVANDPLVPLNWVIKKVNSASIAVTVMSAVAVAAHGNKPNTFIKLLT